MDCPICGKECYEIVEGYRCAYCHRTWAATRLGRYMDKCADWLLVIMVAIAAIVVFVALSCNRYYTRKSIGFTTDHGMAIEESWGSDTFVKPEDWPGG